MTIGILKETSPENRVSLSPESVEELNKNHINVFVENGAGELSFYDDGLYLEAGAKISDRNNIMNNSDIILTIHPLLDSDLGKLRTTAILMGVFSPLLNISFVNKLKERGITSFSLDAVPRVTRAQSMDVLSSMATVAGYKAVLDAAMHLPSFFPMFMTAAGTIKPAKVLVLGAGVAGLQAIATARKLGAQVFAFDVRSAVKEEVQSLGAKFVEVEGAREDSSAGGYAVEQTEDFKKKQAKAVHDQAIKSDVIITTAQIPGKQAPVLIKQSTVDEMKPGSVIVDLAASTGGNCELTKPDEIMKYRRVKIIGQSNYPSTLPADASKMFGKNVVNFLKLLIDKEGNLSIDFEDEIIKSACITHNRGILNERVKSVINQ